MKKLATTATVILLIIFLIMGCDKYHINRYIGDWDFIVEKGFLYQEKGFIGIDTIYYSGKIMSGYHERVIIIKYTEDDEIGAYVDDDGGLHNSTQCYSGKYPFGDFSEKNKKVHFGILWDEGQDTQRATQVIGTKKKGR